MIIKLMFYLGDFFHDLLSARGLVGLADVGFICLFVLQESQSSGKK